LFSSYVFLSKATPPTHISTLSLHDALPISRAITRKRQTIERLVQRGARDKFAGRNLDHDDFVLAVPAVQHCGKSPLRMHSNIDRSEERRVGKEGRSMFTK